MRAVRVGAAIAAVLTVGACAGIFAPPDASRTPTPSPTAHEQVREVEQLDGIALQIVSQNDPRRPVWARWPHVAGHDALSALLDRELQGQIDDFVATTLPSEAAPSIHIDSEIEVRTDALVAVTVRTEEFGGASTSTAARTLWSRDGAVHASIDLVRPDARAALVARVAEAASAAGHVVFDEAEPGEVLTSLLATPEGWRVLVSSGTLGPESEGTIAVELPRAEVAPMLSELGRAFGDEAHPPPPPPPPPPVPVAPGPLSGPVDCAAVACVAITFDDGPGPHTMRLLDVLEQRQAPATFFLVGGSIAHQAATVQRQHALGMQLCSHTMTHPRLDRRSPAQQREEIDRTAAAFAAAIPGGTLPCMRPPYGEYDDATRQLGLPLVLWDVDPRDWQTLDAGITTQRVLEGTHAGSIVLLHDVHPTTVDAVPAIIDGLRAKGFVLVTVDQLIGPMQPGGIYRKR